jgi:hypothetical protein
MTERIRRTRNDAFSSSPRRNVRLLLRRGAEPGHARSLGGQSIALIERLSHASDGVSFKDRRGKMVLRHNEKGRYNPAFRGRGMMQLPAITR